MTFRPYFLLSLLFSFNAVISSLLIPAATVGTKTLAVKKLEPPPTCRLADNSAYSCDLDQSESHGCCSHKLGLLVLAQQWIRNYGPAEHFSIHGLWPDFCDGSWGPEGGCDSSRLYRDVTPHLSKPLIEQMTILWPSYKGDHPKFWAYEWGKHGTCVSVLEPKCFHQGTYFTGQEVATYFQSTVRLSRRYDIYTALKRAGISPRGTNPKDEKDLVSLVAVENAIKKAFNVRPKIRCVKGELDEIMIYFKSQGKETYIPVSTNDKHTCPEKFLYPIKYAKGAAGPKLWALQGAELQTYMRVKVDETTIKNAKSTTDPVKEIPKSPTTPKSPAAIAKENQLSMKSDSKINSISSGQEKESEKKVVPPSLVKKNSIT